MAVIPKMAQQIWLGILPNYAGYMRDVNIGLVQQKNHG